MSTHQIDRNRPYALLSVFDTLSISLVAYSLLNRGYGIIATRSTLTILKGYGITGIIPISEFTGFPECLDDNFKTTHPLIAGSLMYQRGNPEQVTAAKQHGFVDLRVVIVNTNPFQQVVAKLETTFEEAVQQINIGELSLLCAAARNFADVYSVVDPQDYDELIKAIDIEAVDREVAGSPRAVRQFRRYLAAKAFLHCSDYNRVIAGHLNPNG